LEAFGLGGDTPSHTPASSGKDPELVPQSMDWLDAAEFKRQTTTHASNSGPKLRARVEYVRDRLFGE